MSEDINIKTKKIIVVILGIILCISIFSGNKLFNKKERIKNNNNVLKKENNKKEQFAMYIKNEDGNYDKYDGKEFPEGYKINLEKSICEDANGNIVSGAISTTNGKPTVTSNKTIYCTFYMDEHFTSTEVAKDELSKRYYGTNPDNYLCFGTNNKDTCVNDADKHMYRIIGIDKSGRFKVIKKTPIEQNSDKIFYWHNTSSSDIKWPQSDLYKGLNGISGGKYTKLFIGNTTYIPSGWENKIETVNWKYGDIYSSDPYIATNVTVTEMVQKEQGFTTTVSAKIGLMYMADYYFAYQKAGLNCSGAPGTGVQYSKCKTSWMHLTQNNITISENGIHEWIMTRYGRRDSNTYGGWRVHFGGALDWIPFDYTHSVRPVFYLIPSIEISGSGTITDPFIITN